VGDPVNWVWIKNARQWLAPHRCRLSTVLLTKVQRHVRFKQYVITLRSCRPIVHRLRYLLPHVIVIGVNTSASQPSSSASAGDPTPASSLWDKLNAAKSSSTLLASSSCHSRRRVATDHASTADNLPHRADTFAQPKSTVLVGDEPPKVSVSSSSTSHVNCKRAFVLKGRECNY